MDWLPFLLSVALWGLVIGAFARLALPGRDPMSLLQTMLVGIAGSLIGGAIVYAVSDGAYGAGWLGSLVCATAIVYFIRRSRGGGLTDPGRLPDRR